MSNILYISWKSLWHRKTSTLLTIISISLSVALFLGVGKIQDATRDAFSGAISKVDLIVGPRTGTLSLLLYSVFHVGSPTHNVSMTALEYAKSNEAVSWVVPFSLGDGFRGFPVVGTTPEFFDRYKFGNGRDIAISAGKIFASDSEVVIGARVASEQKLGLGDKVVLSHGHTEDGDGFEKHEDHPFQIVGVLALTGTPVDSSVYVSLIGLGEIHRGIGQEGESHGDLHHPDDEHQHGSFVEHNGHLEVKSISGFFLGAKNRFDALNLQRNLNTWSGDSLLAILPGMAVGELWKNLSIFETAMYLVTLCVVLSGVLGLFVSLLIISEQRKREMMIMRAVGASPLSIFSMLVGESLGLAVSGILLGGLGVYGGFAIVRPWIERKFAVSLPVLGLSTNDIVFVGCYVVIGGIVGVVSSVRAYQAAIHDGLGTRF